MAGYITSNNDFYKGNYHSFNLKKTIADAGGEYSHLHLFQFLLTPSLIAVNKTTNKKRVFHDQRGAESLLFIFPPKVQIVLSLLLYYEEKRVEDKFIDLIEYELDSKIEPPDEVIKLNSNISQVPVGDNFYRLLIECRNLELPNRYIENKLKFLLCIKNKELLYSDKDITIRQKIDRVMRVLNYTTPYLELYKDIATMNNRLDTAVLIGQVLGYRKEYIQRLGGIVEQWQLQNLSY